MKTYMLHGGPRAGEMVKSSQPKLHTWYKLCGIEYVAKYHESDTERGHMYFIEMSEVTTIGKNPTVTEVKVELEALIKRMRKQHLTESQVLDAIVSIHEAL